VTTDTQSYTLLGADYQFFYRLTDRIEVYPLSVPCSGTRTRLQPGRCQP